MPLVPGKKRPLLTGWSTIPISLERVERWAREFPNHGIGLRTGVLVGVDVDILDPDLAHQVDQLARDRLGDTLTRVGLWPKRLLPYRTEAPSSKITVGTLEGAKVELLGLGQQFVAFGIHPDTGQPYRWIDDTPLDVAAPGAAPRQSGQLQSLGGEIAALLPSAPRQGRRSSPRRALGPAGCGRYAR